MGVLKYTLSHCVIGILRIGDSFIKIGWSIRKLLSIYSDS